jgi:hypothetical protein
MGIEQLVNKTSTLAAAQNTESEFEIDLLSRLSHSSSCRNSATDQTAYVSFLMSNLATADA